MSVMGYDTFGYWDPNDMAVFVNNDAVPAKRKKKTQKEPKHNRAGGYDNRKNPQPQTEDRAKKRTTRPGDVARRTGCDTSNGNAIDRDVKINIDSNDTPFGTSTLFYNRWYDRLYPRKIISIGEKLVKILHCVIVDVAIHARTVGYTKLFPKILVVGSFVLLVCFLAGQTILNGGIKTESFPMFELSSLYYGIVRRTFILFDARFDSEENKMYDNGKNQANDDNLHREKYKHIHDISKMLDNKMKKYEKLMSRMIEFVSDMMYDEVLDYIKSCEFEFSVKGDRFKKSSDEKIQITIVDIQNLIEKRIYDIVLNLKKPKLEQHRRDNSDDEDGVDDDAAFDLLYDIYTKVRDENRESYGAHRDMNTIFYDILNKETTKSVFSNLIQNSKDYRCCCQSSKERANDELNHDAGDGNDLSDTLFADNNLEKQQQPQQSSSSYVCGEKTNIHPGSNVDTKNNAPKLPLCIIETAARASALFAYDSKEDHTSVDNEDVVASFDDLFRDFDDSNDASKYDLMTHYKEPSRHDIFKPSGPLDEFALVVGLPANNTRATNADNNDKIGSRGKKIKLYPNIKYKSKPNDIIASYSDIIYCKLSFILNDQ